MNAKPKAKKPAGDPNKQKEVRAASFLRMAKVLREKACACEPGQDLSRAYCEALEAFAEVLEKEAELLRGMR